MTELAMRDQRTVAQRDEFTPALAETSALVLWAYEARQAAMVAESLAKTSFIPKSMQGRPADITAAILAGQELGLKPMATLRSIDIVQGTPALRAHAMRGLVQSYGHEVQVVEQTETRCIIRGRRKGETDWQKSTWTMDRAVKLGVVARNPEWKKQPATMLMNRATGEICRMIASDVIYAMPYVAEELDDDTFAGADPIHAEVKPARRTAQRAPRPEPEPAPEPTFDDVPSDVEPISQPQQRKLHATLNELGLGDREDGLQAIGAILGRDIASTKELSKADAMAVINDLDARLAARRDPEPVLDDDWPDTPAIPGDHDGSV